MLTILDAATITSPRSQYSWSETPYMLKGRFVQWQPPAPQVPIYDRSLPGPMRYADLLARFSVAQANAGLDSLGKYRFPNELLELRRTLGFQDPEPANGKYATWFRTRVFNDWPKQAEARLNILAVRMFWEIPAPLEAELISLVRRAGREALLMPLPPITSLDFLIELCQQKNPEYAGEGFRRIQTLRSRDPRAVQAALTWIDLLLAGGEKAQTAKNYAVDQTILSWVTDTLGKPELEEPGGRLNPDRLKTLRAILMTLTPIQD